MIAKILYVTINNDVIDQTTSEQWKQWINEDTSSWNNPALPEQHTFVMQNGLLLRAIATLPINRDSAEFISIVTEAAQLISRETRRLLEQKYQPTFATNSAASLAEDFIEYILEDNQNEATQYRAEMIKQAEEEKTAQERQS